MRTFGREKIEDTYRYYLVLTIGLGVVGVVQSVRWWGSGAAPLGSSLAFLPGLAFLRAYYSSRKSQRRLVHVVAMPLLCIFSLVVVLNVEMIITATTVVTNVKKYDGILSGPWAFNRDLVSHFPRPIPSDAKDARFSFYPSFLQGGAHIQLRYSASSSRISELYDRFAKMKTKSFFGGGKHQHMSVKDGMPTTLFYTSDL